MSTHVASREIEVTYARRERSNHLWIEGEHATDGDFTALFADLAAIGWTDDSLAPLPPYTPWIPDAPPADYQVQPFSLNRRGTGPLFGEQTPAESERFKAETDAVFARHGLIDVPVWAKTLVDML